jgi:hypothetical protein
MVNNSVLVSQYRDSEDMGSVRRSREPLRCVEMHCTEVFAQQDT